MKIGIIGGGSIATFLLQSINVERTLPNSTVKSVLLRRPEVAEEWESRYGIDGYQDLNAFLDSGIDIVVEAATVQAVHEYAEKVIAKRKDLVIISVGALVDQTLYQNLREACRQNGTRITLPSGAIGGLDVIHSAYASGQLESVSLTTRKPPLSLIGREVETEEVVFEGTATEAISKFPKNINVAIVLSLAGLGSDKTTVKIVADPQATKNTHCIEATGAFGRMSIQLENDPMPSNPKTSYLAALSVLSSLKKKTEYISIG
ncbi:dinucleotide-utilizing protein [Brevibacillus panacihumi W25]|uniref:L-aspartate dehydrogenase n=1 Tax=Brevibacillus panacihumi W25 TaxID=1408254 RepID=V6M4Y7_9BACL|nr:aspartate dehydrogenase [Brevibacillus panacihumi]EST53387.1 dinucleotide-utilizing protein [Brevibacillus panacihumi W25]